MLDLDRDPRMQRGGCMVLREAGFIRRPDAPLLMLLPLLR